MLETKRQRYPMTPAERQQVRRLDTEGNGVRDIARLMDRAPSTISRLLRRDGRPPRAPAVRSPRGRVLPTVSRQEVRSIERRIARIEASLARMGRAVGGRPRV